MLKSNYFKKPNSTSAEVFQLFVVVVVAVVVLVVVRFVCCGFFGVVFSVIVDIIVIYRRCSVDLFAVGCFCLIKFCVGR